MADDKAVAKVAAKPPEVQRPLREHRARKVEEAARAHYETEQDLEDTRSRLDEAKVQLTSKDVELAGLRRQLESAHDDWSSRLNQCESRVIQYQAERDRAIAERAAYEVILVAMKRVFDMARLPPPVTEAGQDLAASEEADGT